MKDTIVALVAGARIGIAAVEVVSRLQAKIITKKTRPQSKETLEVFETWLRDARLKDWEERLNAFDRRIDTLQEEFLPPPEMILPTSNGDWETVKGGLKSTKPKRAEGEETEHSLRRFDAYLNTRFLAFSLPYVFFYGKGTPLGKECQKCIDKQPPGTVIIERHFV